MSLKHGIFLEKVMISILFCSLAFGENNNPAEVQSGHYRSRYSHSDLALEDYLIPQHTFRSLSDSNATLIGRWANGPCCAVDVSGNIAYFGNGGYLEVVDISDPANPIELGKVLTPSEVYGIAVSGSYAYVADGWKGLRIIDVSTPSSPVEVGFFDTGGYAWSVAVSGSYAHVADGSDGLRIIDVSTPSSPVEAGFFDTGGDAWSVAVSGSYAYVADGADGLRIIDVSTPSSPVEVGFYDTGDYARGVAVSGSYAYVADGADGLRIIDVTTPSSPVEVGFYDTGGYAYGVAVSGSYAYVADKYDGLRIIDVSTPSNPTEVGFYDTGGSAWSIAVSGDLVYVADGYDGLYIIRNDMAVSVEDDNHLGIPIEFALNQNYPNPFNSTTTISYQLPKSSIVKLSIYDINGRLVETLVNEKKNADYYTVEWNAGSVFSGIYFYRIEAGDFMQVKKCLVVK